jgi:hypothetical protein
VNNCAVNLCRRVAAELRAPTGSAQAQNLVFRSAVTGRAGQTNWVQLPSGAPRWAQTLTGVFDTTVTEARGNQRGTLTQIPDPRISSSVIGCLSLFASEWGFEEGNNEWGEFQRSWDDPEDDRQVDFYMDQSGMKRALAAIMGTGPRKTYFFLAGHSRGGGSTFNIMSWLKRSAPAPWQVVAAVYFDAMHTDGFFQPVTSFPVCAEEMLHFYATQSSLQNNTNCPWDGEHYLTGATANCHGVPPDCPGSAFEQIPVDATHGRVPYAGEDRIPPNLFVLNRARDVIVRKVRELIDRVTR